MWCCDIVVDKLDVFMWCPYNVMSWPEVATMWCHVETMWCHVETMWCHVMSLQCNVMWCWDNVMPCREVVNVMSLQCDVMSWGRDNVMLQYCGGQAGSCSVNLFFFWWFVMLALWFRPEFSEKRLKKRGGGRNPKDAHHHLYDLLALNIKDVYNFASERTKCSTTK